MYLWNNKWCYSATSSDCTPNIYSDAHLMNGASTVVKNRDYYDSESTAKPGYTAYTYPHPLTTGDLFYSSSPPNPKPNAPVLRP